MYEVRSFWSDSSTVMCIDFTLFPAQAVCCLMSVRPRFGFVEYYRAARGQFHLCEDPVLPNQTYLGRNDHLVADATFFHPFADELLRRLVLAAFQ